VRRRVFLAMAVAALCPPFTPEWQRSPGYGWCGKCGRTWDIVERHVTWFRLTASGRGMGCFALCQECWCCLQTPEARMPYYRELWKQWGSRPDVKWDEFERAVRSERERCRPGPQVAQDAAAPPRREVAGS